MLVGEDKVPIVSAVRFMKLLVQYKQQEAFNKLAGDMRQVLSVSSTQASTTVLIVQLNVCCVSE